MEYLLPESSILKDPATSSTTLSDDRGLVAVIGPYRAQSRSKSSAKVDNVHSSSAQGAHFQLRLLPSTSLYIDIPSPKLPLADMGRAKTSTVSSQRHDPLGVQLRNDAVATGHLSEPGRRTKRRKVEGEEEERGPDLSERILKLAREQQEEIQEEEEGVTKRR